MNNQEALMAGVQSWIKENEKAVLETFYNAVRTSADEVALLVANQIALRVGRWLNENNRDLQAGIQLQFSLNQLESNPLMIERIKKQLGLIKEPAVTDTGDDKDGDGD